MLISRLGSVAKSGRKVNQVTHAAEVGGLVFGGTVETSIEATHAAQVGGLTFGATASPIIEVAMGGEVRGLTFAAEYDDRNLVQHGGVVDGLTFAANIAPIVDVSHAAQVGGLVFGASVDPVVGVTHAAQVGGLVFGASVEEAAAEDADAAAYLNAVEAADGQDLEAAVRAAINDFVVGCKADGIWTPIKASCILAGARTLNGALVPLVGTGPKNFNFVAADYARETGLKGNGTSKYLDSNRAGNADPQNNAHVAAFVTETATNSSWRLIGNGTTDTGVVLISGSPTATFFRFKSPTVTTVGAVVDSSLIGATRSASESYTYRLSGTSGTANTASQTPRSSSLFLYQSIGSYANARLSFYSIGEAIDLALLESRVATLMTALNSAIP